MTQQLIINEELKNLLPPLSAEELAGLEADILEHGCLTPLIVWNDILVDGHHRYKICTTHGISFAVNQIECDDIVAAKSWALKNQGNRRNLSPFQRIEIALAMKEEVAAKAKERQLSSLKQNSTVPQTSAERKDTRQELAEIAGVSHTTIDKAEYVLDHADEETKEKLRRGEKGTSINKEYNRLREEEKAGTTDPAPEFSTDPEETGDCYPPLSQPIPEKYSQFEQSVKLQNISLKNTESLIACLFDLFERPYREQLVLDLMAKMETDDGAKTVQRVMSKLNKKHSN